MMSFLGLFNYSRNYIPSYCDNTAILRRLILDKSVRNLTLRLDWSSEAESCFIQLKQLLAHSVTLTIPDYTRPFFLDVSEKDGIVNAALFQKGELARGDKFCYTIAQS
ncbi:hypothetical protein F2P81_009427 [Scophthalmus maximus]|uniref:Reverse transcriptase/retrotransposon-derived protein RNase H-like domain-containing protein n=1 Tax=Scophthalmus maximus TaxID=52904 RepID=A0A6A4SYQ1_SCOMX|nr:hypothetical protein F2P81_009427 [Scophthalmus maximus]